MFHDNASTLDIVLRFGNQTVAGLSSLSRQSGTQTEHRKSVQELFVEIKKRPCAIYKPYKHVYRI